MSATYSPSQALAKLTADAVDPSMPEEHRRDAAIAAASLARTLEEAAAPKSMSRSQWEKLDAKAKMSFFDGGGTLHDS